jgi:hypothetical protein
MTAPDPPGLLPLMKVIAAGDAAEAMRVLEASPRLATATITTGASRNGPEGYFLNAIGRYVYGGHTALHVAAAAYQDEIARGLIARGADVCASNRRGAQPLHEAAGGDPASAHWNPQAQVETITSLIAAGADVNAVDRDAASPLHRAARTRCAAAAAALLDHGADPRLKTKGGSTPLKLATLTTGRGGTGTAAAKGQQTAIIGLLEPVS